MSLPDDIVFHDGGFGPAADATLRVDSLALRYALSAFEGVRLYRRDEGPPRPWLLSEHVQRLESSLRLMRLPTPPLDGLPSIIDKLLELNGLDDDSYVRIAVSAGNGGLLGQPVVPVLSVTARPMGRKPWLANGMALHVVVSDRQRPADAAFPTAAKGISQYAGARLGLLEARAEGFDSCLFTTPDGHVSEAPTAALFVIRRGGLSTPPLTDGPLPSITRAWVLAACARLGIDARNERLRPEDVYAADGAFLCGTGIEFAPIGTVGSTRLPDPGRDPLFACLVRQYFAEARGQAEPTVLGKWQRD